MIFLTAFVVVPVAHDIRAATAVTRMGYNRFDHEQVSPLGLVVYRSVPAHVLSVNMSPLPDTNVRTNVSVSPPDLC
jgi:hypothetical protein